MEIKDEFRVALAVSEELPAVLALYRHFNAPDTPQSPTVALQQAWDEILSNPRMRLMVGRLRGEIVSSCTLVVVPNLTHCGRPYALIENVVTHADHRGQGYATRLLREAQRIAWDLGCYKVMLLTGSKREETLRFYERAGFVRGVKTGFIAWPDSREPK